MFPQHHLEQPQSTEPEATIEHYWVWLNNRKKLESKWIDKYIIKNSY